MRDDISKPYHSDEDKERYDREYDRIFGKKKRQPCEVFSRIVGYIRPVKQWNKGQVSMRNDRKYFDWKQEMDIKSTKSKKH